MEAQIPQYEINVNTIGIKKRCRKVAHHKFRLGYFPIDVDLEKMEAKAWSKLNATMKHVDKADLTFNYVHLELVEGMIEPIVHWSPFDETTKKYSKKIPLAVH